MIDRGLFVSNRPVGAVHFSFPNVCAQRKVYSNNKFDEVSSLSLFQVSEEEAMSSEPKLFSRDVGGPYEPLIGDPERDCEDGKDLEAVRHVDQQEFSLIKYFCFFVVGLSMMWTW